MALRRALPANEWHAVSLWLGTFFRFQLLWLLDWSRFAMLLKARQSGASHTYAGACVLWGMFAEHTTVISRGDREALEVLDKSRRHAIALERLGSQWAKLAKPNKGDIVLESGGRITALPATSGARGYSSNVILDEFAYHADPGKVWDAAAGAATHGFRMRVLSTPNGVGNMFHLLWEDPRMQPPRWARHRVTIEEAVADGLFFNEEEGWDAAHHDPRVFDQLYHCSFLDGDQQYIPTTAIESCVSDDALPFVEGFTYAGLDLGRENDLTVLIIVKQDREGHVWLCDVRECKRTDWDDQIAMVLNCAEDWGIRRLCVDATGIGNAPAETLQKKLGRQRVEPVDFTMQRKEDLATLMYQRFADRSLTIARDEDLMRDVASIRRIVTSAGNVTYDAARTKDGHADRAWALALALRACSPIAGSGKRTDYGYGNYRRAV